MPDVLGAMEHPEGQASEEVSWREVPRHGANLESRLLLQKDVDVIQLRDIIIPGRKVIDGSTGGHRNSKVIYVTDQTITDRKRNLQNCYVIIAGYQTNFSKLSGCL